MLEVDGRWELMNFPNHRMLQLLRPPDMAASHLSSAVQGERWEGRRGKQGRQHNLPLTQNWQLVTWWTSLVLWITG